MDKNNAVISVLFVKIDCVYCTLDEEHVLIFPEGFSYVFLPMHVY